MVGGAQDPLQRPVGDQACIVAMIAAARTSGSGRRGAGFRRPAPDILRVSAGGRTAEGGMRGEVLDRHVAQPLALLAARAILPRVVHALLERIGRPLPIAGSA